MRGCAVVLALVLAGLIGTLAVLHQAELGRPFDPLMPLGLVAALALLVRPLPGSGARGLVIETMKTLGPDSFAGLVGAVAVSYLFRG